MGTIKEHLPVKYFAGLTYNSSVNLDEVLSVLEQKFSAIEIKSHIYDFSGFTDYYESEMGKDLKKHFIVFAKLQSPELLPKFKIATNNIENQFLGKENRQINIDPGYISEAKVVLATTKNYDHRIHLTNGIFADLHLRFSQKTFHAQPWTYPDYKQQSIIEFFNEMRQRYFHQLGEKYSD